MDFQKKREFIKRKLDDKIHKSKLNAHTRNWGTVKFKPQAFRSHKPVFTPPDPQATAKPWQHVKNDIIDDSEELSHASRLNVDSEDARQFMQQREQNHRRNIIETNRSEPTKWETFDDEQQHQQPSTSTSANTEKKSRFWQCDKSKGEMPTDAKNFSFQERNFYRRKLTMGVAMGGGNLQGAIADLKRNQSQLQPGVTKMLKPKDPEPTEKSEGNPFQKGDKPFQKGGKPFQKGSKPFQKGGKPFQKGSKPFQKGRKPFHKGSKPFQKKRKGKKSWEE